MGSAEVVQWLILALSLGISLKVLLKPIVREKTLNRAFRTLEHEVAEQWEKVESHLGRISRLKRDIAKAGRVKEDSDAEQQLGPPKSNAGDSRSALLRNWKQSHAK